MERIGGSMRQNQLQIATRQPIGAETSFNNNDHIDLNKKITLNPVVSSSLADPYINLADQVWFLGQNPGAL